MLRCHHGQPRPAAAHSPWLVRRREPPLVRPRFSEIATRRTNISMKNEVRRAGRKPNSVAPPCGRACGHLSGSFRCRTTPRGQPGAYPLSEIGAGHSVAPYSALLPVGFTVPRVSPRERCALTAPFHPCLIPPPHEAPAGHRRSVLCGTFPGLAAGGRYPPPCPAEFGLSSRSSRTERPHHPLAGLHRYYTTVEASQRVIRGVACPANGAPGTPPAHRGATWIPWGTCRAWRCARSRNRRSRCPP